MYRGCGFIDECVSISCYEIDKDIGNIKCNLLDENIIINCNVICSINFSFLEVNPDIVWLTSEMLSSNQFDIITNLSWTIK